MGHEVAQEQEEVVIEDEQTVPTEDGDLVIGDRRIAIPEGVKTALKILDDNRLLVARIIDETITSSLLFDEWDDREDEDDDDEPVECAIDQQEVDMAVDSVQHGEFTGAPAGYTQFSGSYEQTALPVETHFKCVEDREAVVHTYAHDSSDLTDGSLGENISIELIEDRGYDVIWPEDGEFEDGDETEKGPDLIAYDEASDDWLIVEAKTTTSTEAVGHALLTTNAYDGDPQLSDPWILNSMDELAQRGEIEQSLVSEVEDALDDNVDSVDANKTVVFVRDVDGEHHRTLRNPRSPTTDISIQSGVDEVVIIDLQAVDSEQS